MTYETQVTIPRPLFERLQDEAKRQHLGVVDILQMLLEGKKQGVDVIDARLLHDLLALAPRFQGPQNLSTNYEKILYGEVSS